MLFGVKSSVLNCLLLQVRFLIFRCKVARQTPHMHMHLLLIKTAKLFEKRIAQKHGKLKPKIGCNIVKF